ncbi:MAG: DUF2147 domain-containing protein [bacterium]|nr:DUF2147 domain-containing protein [bacterium]
MNKKYLYNVLRIFVAVFVLAVCLPVTSLDAASMSPVGMWKTIDDKTDEVRSIVKIWKHSDGTLKGCVEKIYPRPNEVADPVCDKCKGHRKNKRIIGMEFMWGFKGEGAKWGKGQILDPENGKIYNCQLEVVDNGEKIKVYGYVRVIFKIGRTQTWVRMKEESRQ